MQGLKQNERHFREAVINESFHEVRAAAEAYRQAFDREWGAMPPAARRRSAMPLEAAQLMRWALKLVTVSRTALAERRRAMGAAGRYLAIGRNERTRTWGSAG